MADFDRTPDAAALADRFAGSGLELTAERVQSLTAHAEAILAGAARLRETDVASAEPPLAFLPAAALAR